MTLNKKVEKRESKLGLDLIGIITLSIMATSLLVSPKLYCRCDKYKEIEKRELKTKDKYQCKPLYE